MNRNVIVILKKCRKTWPEIQSELQNKYSTTVYKRIMKKNWQTFIKTKETKNLARTGRLRKLSVRCERITKGISSIPTINFACYR